MRNSWDGVKAHEDEYHLVSQRGGLIETAHDTASAAAKAVVRLTAKMVEKGLLTEEEAEDVLRRW